VLGIISRLLGNLFVGTCIFSVMLFFFSLALTLRLLPKFLSFLRSMLRWFLILSYRFYNLVLTHLSICLQTRFNIFVFHGVTRVIATVILSEAFGLSILALLHKPLSAWVIAILAIHGLIVGLVWDGIMDPGGFRLGVNIQ
jgi:hypothetical protein